MSPLVPILVSDGYRGVLLEGIRYSLLLRHGIGGRGVKEGRSQLPVLYSSVLDKATNLPRGTPGISM